MNLIELISPKLTYSNVDGCSKKRVLNFIAEYVAAEYPDLLESDVFNGLIQRERLGSTGIGSGVAIPHCRVRNCNSIIGVFVKLAEPIDFDSVDSESVDLIFALIVPPEGHQSHLDALSKIAELFSQPKTVAALRSSEGKKQLYETLISHATDGSQSTAQDNSGENSTAEDSTAEDSSATPTESA